MGFETPENLVRENLVRLLRPLGFESSQYSRTPRPSAERICRKFSFLSDRSKGSEGSSPLLQMARGARLQAGPQLGHVKIPTDFHARRYEFPLLTRTPGVLVTAELLKLTNTIP